MTRECHVRFCERLGVKLPGATLPTGIQNSALNGSMIAKRVCESSSIPGDMPVYRDH